MLKILRAALEVDHEVLVICDDPADESIPIVLNMQREYTNLRLIQNRLGRGVTNAIRAGVEAATGEYVLIFAADEVGPVLAIEDMLALMREGVDFVSCTRYAHGGRRLGGSPRRPRPVAHRQQAVSNARRLRPDRRHDRHQDDASRRVQAAGSDALGRSAGRWRSR